MPNYYEQLVSADDSIPHGSFLFDVDASGKDVSLVKLAYGADGADPTRVTALVGLPTVILAGSAAIGKLAANSGVDIGDVDITSIAAGDNNIGNVDIVTVPADPFGVNADAASATGSISAKLKYIANTLADILGTGVPIVGSVTITDGSGALSIDDNGSSISIDDNGGSITVDGTVGISGTVTVASHAVTNAGVFVVQIDGVALTRLTDIETNTDSLAVVGTGVQATAQRVTIATDCTVVISDGAGSITVDDGGLTLSIDDGGGTITVDGTVAISGAVTVNSHAVTNAGTFVVQLDGAALTALQLIDNIDAAIYTDGAAFTPDTSKIIGVGFQADETATASVTEGDIGCPRMTLDRKSIVTIEPHTSGGLSTYSFLSTAAVQNPTVKASAGKIYSIEFFNKGSAAVYLRLYNKATDPGTGDTPIWRGMVPGNTAASGFVVRWEHGIECATGIGFRCTGAVADNDATVLVANEVMGNVTYK